MCVRMLAYYELFFFFCLNDAVLKHFQYIYLITQVHLL